MSHSLETKIQTVILMAKYKSPVMVIREFIQRRGTTNIPERHAITLIDQKFFETGSVGDNAHTGRPSTITEDKVQEFWIMNL